jgi:hypothetical protein
MVRRVRHCRGRSISECFARELGVVLIRYGIKGRVGHILRRGSSHLGALAFTRKERRLGTPEWANRQCATTVAKRSPSAPHTSWKKRLFKTDTLAGTVQPQSYQACAAADTELAVDADDVLVDGGSRLIQLVGNLFFLNFGQQQRQDPLFGGRQR